MPKENKIIISATEQVKKLWQVGFFKAVKNFRQIDDYLGEKGFHFSPAELGKALERATYLTRRGKRKAYQYIQKGPFEKHE